MLPAVIRRIHEAKLQGLKTVSIWGDGAARREFMYAGDLADCLHRAVANFDSLPDLMNVGVGQDHTIREYYAEVAKAVGYAGVFACDISKPVGMARKLVDTGRLASWGWKPSVSLGAGIKKTYDFFLQCA